MIGLLASLSLAAAPAQSACLKKEELKMASAIALDRGRWKPEVHQRLVELIHRVGAGSPSYDPCHRPLAVFEWDNTVLAGDIGDAAFARASELALFKPHPDLLDPLSEEDKKALEAAWPTGDAKVLRPLFHRAHRDLCREKGNAVCYPWLSQMFQGHDLKELEAFGLELIEAELVVAPSKEELPGVDGVVIEHGVRVRPEMQSLALALQATGIDVFVVTTSPEWLIQIFAPRAGIPREHVRGVRVVIDPSGKLTPVIDPPMPYREGKLGTIRTRIAAGGRRPVLVLGNSESDEQMLDDATELAVLFDRGNAGLRAHAVARGWAIQPVFEAEGAR